MASRAVWVLAVGVGVALAVFACDSQKPLELTNPPPSPAADAGTEAGEEPGFGDGISLEVVVDVGQGGGTVTSDVPGIACGEECSASYPPGTKVTLTATPAAGSGFIGWRGEGVACGSQPVCVVTLDEPRAVGALFAKNGTAGWALHFGSTAADSAPLAALDKDGNLFVAAEYGAAFTVHGQTYDPFGNGDIVLAKFSAAGEVMWLRRIGGAEADRLSVLAVDPTSGDVVVGGRFASPTLELGGPAPLPLEGGEALFLAKYTGPTGTLQWQKSIAASSGELGGLAIDASGDLLLAGRFATSINLGDGALTSAGSEAFLAKLTGAAGAVGWKRKIGGTASVVVPTGLVVDRMKAVVVTGSFSATADFDGVAGGDITAVGATDGFVAKFSGTDGALGWQKQIGGGGDDQAVSITLGPNDSVGVLARCAAQAPITFVDATALAGAGTGTELVVGRIAADGAKIWARRFGGAGDELGQQVASFDNGDLAVTGSFTANVALDAQALTFEGTGADAFVATFAHDSGTATWAARVGSGETDVGRAIAVRGSVVYGLGVFSGTGSFLGASLGAVGGIDVYGFATIRP